MRRLHLAIVALALVALGACGLEERSDFLVGRSCEPTNAASCDPGERCLPHALGTADKLVDFRCRDLASFGPIDGREAPLAYCDELKGYTCPAGMVCNADRVRVDASVRRLVCKAPNDVFAPPYDGGL